jgi:hypothetical protein
MVVFSFIFVTLANSASGGCLFHKKVRNFLQLCSCSAGRESAIGTKQKHGVRAKRPGIGLSHPSSIELGGFSGFFYLQLLLRLGERLGKGSLEHLSTHDEVSRHTLRPLAGSRYGDMIVRS